eukprot:CAMPEP_0117647832 /NCGR_PEP_ID=MMETSP0804-20121206/58_1 /TAXON_ID=1074897 /ORGANISM="Tetraselmis astigmatica, Strain CCMP880" /LENGTH=142 /DNA_ID=CAMNT_0005453347 /DNA_START=131 /DNA_END=559 /DNA_ORIENTATION=-
MPPPAFRKPSHGTCTVLLSIILAAALVCQAGCVSAKNKRRTVGGTANSLLDRDLKVKRHECEAQVDQSLPSHERENLILACVSEVCFEKLYGNDHLEEGEIDSVRGRHYRSCCREVLRDERNAAKAADREASLKAREEAAKA